MCVLKNLWLCKVLALCVLLGACEEQVFGTIVYNRDDGLAYLPGAQTPFTGISDVYFKDNGQLYIRTPYKAGKIDGLAERWHKNGQLAAQSNFKDGKLEGLDRWWYENGQQRWAIFYKGDTQQGRARYWREDGSRDPDICWQNGKQAALHLCAAYP